jgi:hypothetical protein
MSAALNLTDEELQLLKGLANDPDGTLRTKARPGPVVKELARKQMITHVITASFGWVSVWRITEAGRCVAASSPP